MRILLFLLLLLPLSTYSQKSYPYLYEDSIGDQFVILTFEQAQRLDNATEFSPILWKNHTSYYQLVDSLCEKKLESKNFQINTLKSNIDTLKGWSITYMKSYEVCKEKLGSTQNKNDVLIEINDSLKQKIQSMEEHDLVQEKELKKSKRETNLSIAFGFISTVVIFLISL